MLRPATPLTVVLFCAFVLLLISSLSTPVIPSIPLARWQNYNFGVLGFCQDGGACSHPKVGYTTDNIFGNSPPPFNLPSSARHSLSSLLIVHPVAAFMALIMLALAAAAHFHAPSHSPRYLLALLILTLPTLLITLLAFLVDILLFIPYLAWGGWICLAATILIVIAGICLCAMRRTLVSRKARRKRIQENAEMSGENFYNRQRDQEVKLAAVTTASSESKAPLVQDSTRNDMLPTHATYEQRRSDELQYQQPVPLSAPGDEKMYDSLNSGSTLNNSPPGMLPPNQYADGRSVGPSPDGAYLGSQWTRGRGGPPIRGRGGQRPYGRGGPRGGGPYRGPPPPGFSGRGGFGPDIRGAYRGRGGTVPPHIPGPGYIAGGMGGRRPPPGYPPPQNGAAPHQYAPGQPEYGQPTSPSDYSRPSPPDTAYQAYGNHEHSPERVDLQHSSQQNYAVDDDRLVRAETPPPMETIGQAIDTDGQNSMTPARAAVVNPHPTHQEVERSAIPEQYVPARASWNERGASRPNPPRGGSAMSHSSSNYYEDMPTKFLDHSHPMPEPAAAPGPAIPVINQPGDHELPRDGLFEELPAGARSPATSEQSAWTSVSQRPVNPDWKPGHGGEFNSFGPPKKMNQSHLRQDMILSNNPDFSVPGMGPPRGAGRGRGGYRAHPPPPMPPSGLELGPDGRYPEPAVMSSREI